MNTVMAKTRFCGLISLVITAGLVYSVWLICHSVFITLALGCAGFLVSVLVAERCFRTFNSNDR